MSKHENLFDFSSIDADNMQPEEMIKAYISLMRAGAKQCGCFACKAIMPDLDKLAIEEKKGHNLCLYFGGLRVIEKLIALSQYVNTN